MKAIAESIPASRRIHAGGYFFRLKSASIADYYFLQFPTDDLYRLLLSAHRPAPVNSGTVSSSIDCVYGMRWHFQREVFRPLHVGVDVDQLVLVLVGLIAPVPVHNPAAGPVNMLSTGRSF